MNLILKVYDRIMGILGLSWAILLDAIKNPTRDSIIEEHIIETVDKKGRKRKMRKFITKPAN